MHGSVAGMGGPAPTADGADAGVPKTRPSWDADPAAAPVATAGLLVDAARGRTAIDRSVFASEVRVKAVACAGRDVQGGMRALGGRLLTLPKVKNVVVDARSQGGGGGRLLLLDEEASRVDAEGGWAGRETLGEEGKVWVGAREVVDHVVELGYGHLGTDVVLRRILPAGVEVPGSFEQVGHIAHLNLRADQHPYRHAIAEAILDKNAPRLRCVVNKVGSINATFRTFDMEVLAGEGVGDVVRVEADGQVGGRALETELVEYQCRFKLDYARVYWNSRLEAEHRRLIDAYFSRGSVVVDMMAGIGPFAVPAAAVRGCEVYANDLNPHAVKWLRVNVERNVDKKRRVAVTEGARKGRGKNKGGGDGAQAKQQREQQQQGDRQQSEGSASKVGAVGRVHVYNMCGRQFVRGLLLGEGETERPPAEYARVSGGSDAWPVEPLRSFDHAVMNLPASAIEFLDTFRGLFREAVALGRWDPARPLPRIHCYCFAPHNATPEDVMKMASERLGSPGCLVAADGVAVHDVRDVSPSKHMFCISFPLPRDVAFAEDVSAAKRRKT